MLWRNAILPMRLLIQRHGFVIWHSPSPLWAAQRLSLFAYQHVSRSAIKRRKGTVATLAAAGRAKVKEYFVCTECGEKYIQWTGKCRACGAWNTLEKKTTTALPTGSGGGAGALAVAGLTSAGNPDFKDELAQQIAARWNLPQRNEWVPGTSAAVSLKDIGEKHGTTAWRLPLQGETGAEIARVLGGGVVPGTLTLIGGDPGIGKSTLLLQVAAMLASQGHAFHDTKVNASQKSVNAVSPRRVLYVSGEESADQIYSRAERLQISDTENLYVMTATQLEVILADIAQTKPTLVILDSIQTVYLGSANGSAGSISQVRECGTALCHLAKASGVPMFLVGHVTKQGDIAGPKLLEHVVDAVLYLEGERHQFYRVLRGMKNRYGPTDEIGVFQMDTTGLHVVPNPSAMFLRDRRADVPGVSSAVAVLVEGTRPLMLEVQALCTRTTRGQENPLRIHGGVLYNRLSLVIAILTKHVHLKLHLMNLHLNVIGGLLIKEPAGDVAIAVAIASSYFDQTVPADVAVVGELGLGGELRPVIHLDKRLTEVSKLGFRRCIVPAANIPGAKSAIPKIKGLDVVQCDTINDVLRAVLGTSTMKRPPDHGHKSKGKQKGVPVDWDEQIEAEEDNAEI